MRGWGYLKTLQIFTTVEIKQRTKSQIIVILMMAIDMNLRKFLHTTRVQNHFCTLTLL